MTILLAPDRNSPVFTFLVVYRVGSRNEAPATPARRTARAHDFNKSTENSARRTAPHLPGRALRSGAD